MRIFAILAILAAMSVAVFADQAAYVTRAEAERALSKMKDVKQIKHYCAPCDDKSVRTEDVNTIEIAPTEDGKYWEVKVNGEGIDLAYVYYQAKKGKWKNAAKEAKIEVSDVPDELPNYLAEGN